MGNEVDLTPIAMPVDARGGREGGREGGRDPTLP